VTVADTFGSVLQKRDYYLQIMEKAQQLNDQILIQLVLKKLGRLGMTSADSTTNGCIIIPFPTLQYSAKCKEYERVSWWTLLKLTLAVPGSLVALLLLAYYRYGPGVY
jgi:hypothetical protein